WFCMASYFVVLVLRKARSLVADPLPREPSRPYLRDVVLSVVISYLTLPVVVPACQSFFAAYVHRALDTEADREDDPDRKRLEDWLQHPLPHGDGFYRLCVNTGHNHELMDLAVDVPV